MIDLRNFLDYKLFILILLTIFYSFLFTKKNKLQDIWTWKTTTSFNLVLLGFILYVITNFEISSQYKFILSKILNFIIIVCFTNLFLTIVHICINVYSKRKPQPLILNLIDLFIYIFGAIFVIRTIFKIEVSSILTTSAIITGAIVFALQHSLTNIFSGITLQLNENFKPGTWIRVKEKDILREIINRGFYFTTLKTLDNVIFLIPNYYFYSNIFSRKGNTKY